MRREFNSSIRLMAVLTLLTGVVYPFLMMGIAQSIFPHKANGSMVVTGNRCVGSALVGQKFEHAGYFWPRPSATDYNPLPSGGSNLAATGATLAKTLERRAEALMVSNGDAFPPPELVYASGSGLDPHISPEAAYYQVPRVAAARRLDESQTRRLHEIVKEHIEGRTLGFIGEPRVNVLLLNLALDSL